MRKTLITALAVMVSIALAAPPSEAITFGQPDGNGHPNVGTLVIELEGERLHICSGTLISPTVFLTAGHCTDFLPALGIETVWVSFDPLFDPGTSALVSGTYVTAPDLWHDHADPLDLAVVLLDSAVAATPALLPTEGLLDSMKRDLRGQTFTAVGYGARRETITGGFQAIFDNDERRFATQGFLSLQKSWLTLNMNPRTGSGGTCYGDSGGPHFLGGPESNLIVSITVTGDAVCKATDQTYRLDTPAARAFLGQFVTIP